MTGRGWGVVAVLGLGALGYANYAGRAAQRDKDAARLADSLAVRSQQIGDSVKAWYLAAFETAAFARIDKARC